jgi:hypothetical protein
MEDVTTITIVQIIVSTFGWLMLAVFIVGNILMNRKVAFSVVKEKYERYVKRKKKSNTKNN